MLLNFRLLSEMKFQIDTTYVVASWYQPSFGSVGVVKEHREDHDAVDTSGKCLNHSIQGNHLKS